VGVAVGGVANVGVAVEGVAVEAWRRQQAVRKTCRKREEFIRQNMGNSLDIFSGLICYNLLKCYTQAV